MTIDGLRALARHHHDQAMKAWTAAELHQVRGRLKAGRDAAAKARFHTDAHKQLAELAIAFSTLAQLTR